MENFFFSLKKHFHNVGVDRIEVFYMYFVDLVLRRCSFYYLYRFLFLAFSAGNFHSHDRWLLFSLNTGIELYLRRRYVSEVKSFLVVRRFCIRCIDIHEIEQLMRFWEMVWSFNTFVLELYFFRRFKPFLQNLVFTAEKLTFAKSLNELENSLGLLLKICSRILLHKLLRL